MNESLQAVPAVSNPDGATPIKARRDVLDEIDLLKLRLALEHGARLSLLVEVAKRDEAAAQSAARAFTATLAERYGIDLATDSVDSETGAIKRAGE